MEKQEERGSFDNPKSAAEYSIRNLCDEFRWGLSFLSSDTRYAKIREIFLNDNFKFLKMDLNDHKSFVDLKRQFQQKGLIVDVVYASNTRDYCERESYTKSLKPFALEATYFIDTYPKEIQNKWTQRVRHLQSSNEKK